MERRLLLDDVSRARVENAVKFEVGAADLAAYGQLLRDGPRRRRGWHGEARGKTRAPFRDEGFVPGAAAGKMPRKPRLLRARQKWSSHGDPDFPIRDAH